MYLTIHCAHEDHEEKLLAEEVREQGTYKLVAGRLCRKCRCYHRAELSFASREAREAFLREKREEHKAP